MSKKKNKKKSTPRLVANIEIDGELVEKTTEQVTLQHSETEKTIEAIKTSCSTTTGVMTFNLEFENKKTLPVLLKLLRNNGRGLEDLGISYEFDGAEYSSGSFVYSPVFRKDAKEDLSEYDDLNGGGIEEATYPECLCGFLKITIYRVLDEDKDLLFETNLKFPQSDYLKDSTILYLKKVFVDCRRFCSK